MSDKLWKKIERKVANALGGVRVPVTGRQRGSAPDIEHDLFSIEVKHRETLPEWLMDAMEQANMSRTGDKLPMVVLHQKGQPIIECLTVMKLGDILTLKKRLEDLEEEFYDMQETFYDVQETFKW